MRCWRTAAAIALLCAHALAWGQTSNRKSAPAPRKAVEATPRPSAVRFNAAGRRDPFLNPILLRRKADELNQEVTPQYVPPGIAGTYIAQAKLLGILSKGGIPTAVFQANDQRAYFMKESEKLLDGYIKKIDSDSVLLVRETHLRSGKTITQDVVKRLRTP